MLELYYQMGYDYYRTLIGYANVVAECSHLYETLQKGHSSYTVCAQRGLKAATCARYAAWLLGKIPRTSRCVPCSRRCCSLEVHLLE